MNNEEVLQKLGLNEKETRVYLASLELGLARVNEISKKSGIIRETTYGIINSLIQKGLMSNVIKSGVRYFELADPKKLMAILKEKEKLLLEILPNLESIKKYRVDKPRVEFYEGKEGLKTIMEDILKTKQKEILIIASNKNLNKILEFYFPNFIKRRVKLRIKARLLTDEKVLTKELIKYKYLPKNFEFKTATYIYDNKIAMISLNQIESVGVLIDNKDIVDTQRNFFNLLWGLLEKL